MDWELYPNFNIHEFSSPDISFSGNRMKEDLLEKLQKAREIAKIPFRITSGYRSKKHNKKVGGSRNSSHLNGWAVDIACDNSFDREKILRSAFLAGFPRIGVSNTFIHLDVDPTKNNAVWTYPAKSKNLIKILFNSDKPEDV